MGYTKLQTNGIWATANTQIDEGWEKIVRVDGVISAPQGLVDQLQSETEAKALDDWKANRQAQVDAIVVTTTSGKQFDGDEKSQSRMNIAWGLMDLMTDTTDWSLADTPTGVMTQVTKAELKEACTLAGQAQTAIWGL